ncbi:Pentatricopeptide repeat [Dillenia turbinata]|uniref:Pentatricopeptide repeat n=1 Tax=Dillenia turbinata TaxID=194707 RepID=A0AAN8Z1W2_9MAGN
MPDKDVISWTSLVTGYAHNGFHEEAIKLFCDMRSAKITPDHFVIASVFSGCAELTLLAFGQQVHADFVKSGLESSLSVDNSLVALYAKGGCIEDANRIFDSMRDRDVITWTSLIAGYAQNGRGNDSIRFYQSMILSGCKPDFVTFIGLLFACSHAGLVDDGLHYFKTMDKIYAIKPDATVWKALLAACRVHKNVELAERAAYNLFELEPLNAMPYVLLSNIYSASGRWEDAARTRRLMKSRGVNKEPGRILNPAVPSRAGLKKQTMCPNSMTKYSQVAQDPSLRHTIVSSFDQLMNLLDMGLRPIALLVISASGLVQSKLLQS